MQPHEIRSLLVAKRIRQRDLAVGAKANRTAVSETIAGRRKTPFIRRAVAVAIDLPYADVWGEDDPGVDRLRSITASSATQPRQNTDGDASDARPALQDGGAVSHG